MSYSNLTILPVGQGNCSLVEVYDESELIFLGMVDCGVIRMDGLGSDDDPRHHIKKSLDRVEEKMRKRRNAMGTAKIEGLSDSHYLDLFLLTHQDNDHWSLMDKFLREHFGLEQKKWYQKTFLGKNTFVLENNNELFEISSENNEKIYYYESEQMNFTSPASGFVTFNFKKAVKDKEEGMLEISVRFDDGKYYEIIANLEKHNEEWYHNISNKLDSKKSILKQLIEFSNENFLKKLQEDFGEEYANHLIIPRLIETLCSEIENQFQLILDKKFETPIEPCDQIGSVVGKAYYGGILHGSDSNEFKKLLDILSVHKIKELVYDDKTTSPLNNTYNESDFLSFQLLSKLKSDSIIATTKLRTEANPFIMEAQAGSDLKILRNASAAVTLWTIHTTGGDIKYLFTGDATVHTMYELLNRQGSNILSNCNNAIMTAPHHGSDKTSEGMLGGRPEVTGNYSILRCFLKKVKPKAIAVSAGYNSRFGHPGKNFIKECINALNQNENTKNITVDKHGIYYCFNKGEKDFKCCNISKPLYCNVQCSPQTLIGTPTYDTNYYIHTFNNDPPLTSTCVKSNPSSSLGATVEQDPMMEEGIEETEENRVDKRKAEVKEEAERPKKRACN